MLNSSGGRPARCSFCSRSPSALQSRQAGRARQTHRQQAGTPTHGPTRARRGRLSSIHHSLLLRAEAKLTDSTREGEEAKERGSNAGKKTGLELHLKTSAATFTQPDEDSSGARSCF